MKLTRTQISILEQLRLSGGTIPCGDEPIDRMVGSRIDRHPHAQTVRVNLRRLKRARLVELAENANGVALALTDLGQLVVGEYVPPRLIESGRRALEAAGRASL